MAVHRRSNSFRHARTVVAERLAQGAYPAVMRLAAADLGAELGASPTSMREVLARFVGEGLLVERPGQGVFVPRRSAREIADLYRLSLAHLQIALRARRVAAIVEAAGDIPSDRQTAIASGDALLGRWVADAGSPLLARSYGRLQRQLAPIRRLEAEVVEDLVAEYGALAAYCPTPAKRLARVRDFPSLNGVACRPRPSWRGRRQGSQWR